MSTTTKRGWSKFSIVEWHRLSGIAQYHEPQMRLAYLQAVKTRTSVGEEAARNAVALLFVETCDTTARIYGMNFNPTNPIYGAAISRLTDQFLENVNSRSAKEQVKRIVPRNISLAEYGQRIDTWGLDARSAVRIERMHQAGRPIWEILSERNKAILVRGNMIATTEANRVVNHALLALWKSNSQMEIYKARRNMKVEYVGTSRRQIMAEPHKTWMTRRDDKVCKYCDPLEGISARLDAEFDTQYGIFEAPPIHPNCRCFMVLG